jgi:hypothetical protein
VRRDVIFLRVCVGSKSDLDPKEKKGRSTLNKKRNRSHRGGYQAERVTNGGRPLLDGELRDKKAKMHLSFGDFAYYFIISYHHNMLPYYIKWRYKSICLFYLFIWTLSIAIIGPREADRQIREFHR